MNFQNFLHSFPQEPHVPPEPQIENVQLNYSSYQYSNEFLDEKTSDIVQYVSSLTKSVDNNLNTVEDVNANTLHHLKNLNKELEEVIDVKHIQTKLSFALKFIDNLINTHACEFVHNKFWCNLSDMIDTNEWPKLVQQWCVEYQQVYLPIL